MQQCMYTYNCIIYLYILLRVCLNQFSFEISNFEITC